MKKKTLKSPQYVTGDQLVSYWVDDYQRLNDDADEEMAAFEGQGPLVEASPSGDVVFNYPPIVELQRAIDGMTKLVKQMACTGLRISGVKKELWGKPTSFSVSVNFIGYLEYSQRKKQCFDSKLKAAYGKDHARLRRCPPSG